MSSNYIMKLERLYTHLIRGMGVYHWTYHLLDEVVTPTAYIAPVPIAAPPLMELDITTGSIRVTVILHNDMVIHFVKLSHNTDTIKVSITPRIPLKESPPHEFLVNGLNIEPHDKEKIRRAISIACGAVL